MIKILTFFSPSSFFQLNLPHDAIFVGVDILRAGTTLCTALANKAKEVVPVVSSEVALRLYNRFDRDNVLLCGERNGQKIEGYALGNSPLEFTSEKVNNKTLILDTTNGSKIFANGLDFRYALVGAFINFTSIFNVISKIISSKNANMILLVCAGDKGGFSFEDALFCGSLAKKIAESSNKFVLDDATRASIDLFELHKPNLCEFVKSTSHAKNLIALGYEEDINYALTTDLFAVVPISNGVSYISYRPKDGE
ncbi:MAG: 2-phosphosulfolactate phosphatase [Ignavibacteria bacterium]|nr:2-phosphosulfolactate phosphatase [Ignavibacteria bacterium]